MKSKVLSDPTLANRFLAHQLSDAERVMLEAELTVNPQIVEELEATARMKIGLQRLRESGELQTLLTPVAAKPYKALALAATVAVSVAVTILFGNLATAPAPRLASSIDELISKDATLQHGSADYFIFQKRSANSRIRITLPAARLAMKLRVLPTVEIAPPFRITLAKEKDRGIPKILSSVDIAAVATDGYIDVFVDSARLSDGRYRLSVAGRGIVDLQALAGGRDAEQQESFVLDVSASMQ